MPLKFWAAQLTIKRFRIVIEVLYFIHEKKSTKQMPRARGPGHLLCYVAAKLQLFNLDPNLY